MISRASRRLVREVHYRGREWKIPDKVIPLMGEHLPYYVNINFELQDPETTIPGFFTEIVDKKFHRSDDAYLHDCYLLAKEFDDLDLQRLIKRKIGRKPFDIMTNNLKEFQNKDYIELYENILTERLDRIIALLGWLKNNFKELNLTLIERLIAKGLLACLREMEYQEVLNESANLILKIIEDGTFKDAAILINILNWSRLSDEKMTAIKGNGHIQDNDLVTSLQSLLERAEMAN